MEQSGEQSGVTSGNFGKRLEAERGKKSERRVAQEASRLRLAVVVESRSLF